MDAYIEVSALTNTNVEDALYDLLTGNAWTFCGSDVVKIDF